MVAPPKALVTVGIADLRAEPTETSELVDQAHLTEMVTVLGERNDWRYVQGPDQYFGWVRAGQIFEVPGSNNAGIVAVLLADVHERESRTSPVIERLPAGTRPPQNWRAVGRDGANARPEWGEIPLRWDVTRSSRRSGFLAVADTTDDDEVPSQYPTADDYLKTAESFIGIPYLWGGTTALGLDCSGFVQQVYRLNGVALPRDADQQAMLGRRVEEARASDLLFFGAESVTHVALATSATEFIQAPMKGVVERSRLGGDRVLRGIRRYVPDVSTA